MLRFKPIILCLLLIFVLSFSVFAQSNRVDSDGDGVLDEYDECPGTNPDEGLPIILRNPEFLGCSCSQIFNLMNEDHCKEIYCFPGRPLEIRNSVFSSRRDPCPPPTCDGETLYMYLVDEIRCHQGRELPYECEEVIIENSDICINGLENDDFFVFGQNNSERDIFDVVVFSYLEGSRFVNILNIKSRNDLVANSESVLKKVDVERVVSISERVVNNRRIMFADVSLIITPKTHVKIDDFVFVERIIGDLSDKNLVISGESFFDSNNYLIVWELDSLTDTTIFSYRITPSSDLDFEFFVQGTSRSTFFKNLVLPLLLIILVFVLVVSWIVSMKEKNRVFKN